jgi:hypothetical protein
MRITSFLAGTVQAVLTVSVGEALHLSVIFTLVAGLITEFSGLTGIGP